MKRQESKEGPPLLLLNSTREDNRRRARFNGRYNYLHDTVIAKLDETMNHYPLGDFDSYIADWIKSDAIINARPSKFQDTRRLRTFTIDRFESTRKFMFQIIDHIRQSINMLNKYHDAKALQQEYERIIRDPYVLMRYQRQRFRNPTVESSLNIDGQLNVVPILKPYIINYINEYGFTTETSVRPIDQIDDITDYANVISITAIERDIKSIIDDIIERVKARLSLTNANAVPNKNKNGDS
jgi:hypothetical protein